MYKDNIFTQIISGKAPAQKLYEDEILIAINDINPAAQIHILVIPKGKYIDFNDFVNNANGDEITHYFKTIAEIANKNGINEYRLVFNKGSYAGQTIFHFHAHILSGLDNKNLIDKNL